MEGSRSDTEPRIEGCGLSESHPRIMMASVLGGGEDIGTLAALTANRRLSPTALDRPDAEPYPVAATTHHEASGRLSPDRRSASFADWRM
jgi:hypothetical protein